MTNEMNTEIEPKLEKPSIFGMIMNPREQFERIRENPKIIVALLLVTVLTIVGMLLMLNGMDFVGDDPELASMSEEEIMFITLFGQISFVVVGLFTPIVSILIAAVVHIIIAKIVQSDVSFKQLFSMNTYIFMISAISMILNGLVFMFIGGDPEMLFTSLNSIIGAEGMLGAFFNSIEIFTIWALIITALGLQVVARFSKGLSWAVVIGFYVVGLVFQLISAGITTAFGV